MRIKLAFVAGVMSLVWACSEAGTTSEAENTVAASIPREEIESNIEANNVALTNLTNPDSMRFICQAQIDLCKKFVELYAKDPKVPVFLTYQAKAHRANNQFKEAVQVYNTIEQRYPEFDGIPEVMFVKAFILDEELDQKDQAKEAYNALITKFPNHPFSKDAQALLTQLHMSDDELIKMFEEKNKK